jgi:soluble lytic murein transglycosylase-like protein
MQLMPKTAATLGVDDPFDPKANIDAGVRHLRAMMDRFDNNIPLALAAYNAGEVAVIKHRGVPPYRETRAYVKRILKRLDRSTAAAQL